MGKPLASKQQRTFTVHASGTAFPVNGLVSDYRIEIFEDFFILHFAGPANSRRAFVSIAIDIDSLNTLKQTLTSYAANMADSITGSYSSDRSLTAAETIGTANIIAMGHRKNVAETSFHNFSMVAQAAVGTAEMDAQPLVFLKSSTNLQKSLLIELYSHLV